MQCKKDLGLPTYLAQRQHKTGTEDGYSGGEARKMHNRMARVRILHMSLLGGASSVAVAIAVAVAVADGSAAGRDVLRRLSGSRGRVAAGGGVFLGPHEDIARVWRYRRVDQGGSSVWLEHGFRMGGLLRKGALSMVRTWVGEY
jgi:hypothetical protein